MTRDIRLPKEVASGLVMIFGGKWCLKFISKQIIPYKEGIDANYATANEAISLLSRNFGDSRQRRPAVISPLPTVSWIVSLCEIHRRREFTVIFNYDHPRSNHFYRFQDINIIAINVD